MKELSCKSCAHLEQDTLWCFKLMGFPADIKACPEHKNINSIKLRDYMKVPELNIDKLEKDGIKRPYKNVFIGSSSF